MTTTAFVSRADRAAGQMLESIEQLTGVPTALPVDPIRIARELGITVFVANLKQDTSAMLQKYQGKDPVMYLSAADSLNRQRFSCAHELGHYVARQGEDEDYGYIDNRDQMSSRGTDPAEVWANRFAAALLMPAEQVRPLGPPYDAVSLAPRFGVSAEAMGYRLRNLRLS